MAMKFKAEEYEAIDPGVYRAKLGDLKEDETKFGPCLKFYFELTEEDYEGQTLQGLCNIPDSFNSATKLWQWSQALLGRTIEAGEDINLEQIIGRECMLTVSHKETDRGTFARIDAVNPIRRKKPKKQPPVVEEDEEEDEEEEDDDSGELANAPF